MTIYYLDASALCKRYVEEAGSGWVRALVAPSVGHTVLTARISMVEIHSALERRRREGSVAATDVRTAIQALTIHGLMEYTLVELQTTVVSLARDLLSQHPLRAYDAVQLGSALAARQVLTSAGLRAPIFVSADKRLNMVAKTEGFTVDDPRQHL